MADEVHLLEHTFLAYIGLARKFVWVFADDHTEKPKQILANSINVKMRIR